MGDLRRFDFNRGTLTPTAAGYIGVAGANTFTTLAGYGWQTVAGDTERGSGGGTFTDLLRDLHYGMAANTFRFEVVPGQAYDLRVYVGDYSILRDQIQVSIEGAAPYVISSVAPGVFDLRLTSVASAVDSIMDVTFSDLGGTALGWVVNGIDVATAGALPGATEIDVQTGTTSLLDGGTVAFGSTTPLTPLQKTFVITNSGLLPLTLGTLSVTPGSGFSVVSGFGTTTVQPYQTTSFTLQLDALSAGSFSGTVSFATNDADENPFNFDVSGSVVTPSSLIIGNDDAGFSAPGYTFFSGQGFQNDVHYAAAGSGSNVATWTFTNLTPGTYRVSATWSTHANRATNAPFMVYNGTVGSGTSLGTIAVNQEQLTINRTDAGANWQDLGSSFVITGSTLAVKLTNAANEYVIADGIRIELIGTPLLAAGGAVTGPNAGILTGAQLQPVVAAAITRLEHEGYDRQVLSRVVFTIEDLPGATLGLAGSQAVSIDVNAAGHGWFVDATPLDDREFSDGSAPPSAMDLLSVVMHELGHTVGLVDLHDADDAGEMMAALLPPGTRRDDGAEHVTSESVRSPQITTRPVTTSAAMTSPAAAEPSDLFSVGDAVVDVSRYAILQQPVNRLSTSMVKVEDPDMRQSFGRMSETDNSDLDLSSAEIDDLFLGLLDPASAFDLFS